MDNYQQIAADADKDGQIVSFDAMLIVRHVVGLPPISYSSYVSEWTFSPGGRSYHDISTNNSNQNYVGVIIGNVHGEWTPPGSLKKIKPISVPYKYMAKLTCKIDEITMPLIVEPAQEILSADIEIIYNADDLNFIKVEKTMLSQNFHLLHNNENGRLRVAMYCLSPVNEGGILLKLFFKKIHRGTSTTSLELKKFLLNNNVIYHSATEVMFDDEPSTVTNHRLNQNYPNPFNSITNITFSLPIKQRIWLTIYDVNGQVVTELLNSKVMDSGQHTIVFDANNLHSGLYFYELKTEKFRKINRMLLIK